MESNRKPTAQELSIKTNAIIISHILDFPLKLHHSEVKQTLLDTILKCYTLNPVKRESARDIFDLLNEPFSKFV